MLPCAVPIEHTRANGLSISRRLESYGPCSCTAAGLHADAIACIAILLPFSACLEPSPLQGFWGIGQACSPQPTPCTSTARLDAHVCMHAANVAPVCMYLHGAGVRAPHLGPAEVRQNIAVLQCLSRLVGCTDGAELLLESATALGRVFACLCCGADALAGEACRLLLRLLAPGAARSGAGEH